ncbi:Retrovirus-related Pol polyprotein from transposon TNT 1-94 [Eumeta japonica]|uniref:Retrovirus-related Pol polyprotein from transposon TNT 1-94 n=1 Tax=Eumeta variegata TaxID=151549 RepID=A0A4C1SWH4_EUMVA|nr:Retrovirus-related Pol polyprotein from transposon TNT 1-94 [Eumeta japonica]
MLRSDNGREYNNKTFDLYLQEHGIVRQLTVAYTPQQNGVAERANRTLVEMSRAMLLHANLGKHLWAEAVSTAVYLRNRSPTKALLGKTPFEVWYGYKPKVGHLRVFGSYAVALDKTQKQKFDAKGQKYVMVGYSQAAKAYRLYDETTRKIIERRDVRFDEHWFDDGSKTEE